MAWSFIMNTDLYVWWMLCQHTHWTQGLTTIETECLLSSWLLCFNKKEKTTWMAFYLTQERNLSSDKKEYILNREREKKNNVEGDFFDCIEGNRLERQKGHTGKARGCIILVPISTTTYKNHSIVLKGTVPGSQSWGKWNSGGFSSKVSLIFWRNESRTASLDATFTSQQRKGHVTYILVVRLGWGGDLKWILVQT